MNIGEHEVMVRATETMKSSSCADAAATNRSASAFRFSQMLNMQPPLEEAPVAPSPPEIKTLPEKNDFNTESIYVTLRDYMQKIRSSVKNGDAFGIETPLLTINKIVAAPEILAGINPMMIKLDGNDDYYILQPIHTMIYALKIGLLLNYKRKEMTELGLAALLHNVGMFLIPDEIIHKTDALTDEEIAVIKKHPENGRDLVLSLKGDFPSVVEAVYQHHERENGHGYPQGLKGEAIVEYAQIIGICDSYEAMSHNRPHKKALLQFTSVRQLIETKEKLFSSKIIKAFLEEMSLYPVGSYVRLNNGSIGRVIKTNRSQPVKPLVRIMFDGLGERETGDEYTDLSKTSVLNIVDVIAESDLPE